jgi:RNA polymerase sigma-70 factor (ECF subfamily)
LQAINTLSDFELVDLARAGKNAAFAEIVSRHKGIVATVAMNMLGDREDASEIGQQVFIQLYRSLNKFRKESKLSTYLTRITMNLCLNFLKRRKKFQSRSLDLTKAETRHAVVPTNFEDKELINQALQMLDHKYRSVIVVRMIQGYSTLEAAEILNIPKGTVLSRLKRGMAKMKIILETDLKYKHE